MNQMVILCAQTGAKLQNVRLMEGMEGMYTLGPYYKKRYLANKTSVKARVWNQSHLTSGRYKGLLHAVNEKSKNFKFPAHSDHVGDVINVCL